MIVFKHVAVNKKKMSAISSTENPQLHQIDLTKLNIAQLTQLKQQLDQVYIYNLSL